MTSKLSWVKHKRRMGEDAFKVFALIAQGLNVPFVIAVGSRATDTYADTSDYDIVIPSPPSSRAAFAVRVKEVSDKLNVKIDFMVSDKYWPTHGIIVDAATTEQDTKKKVRKNGKI